MDIYNKVDYRIIELSRYPRDISIKALVITDGKLVNSHGIEVEKSYPFLNTVKVRGPAKALVELAKDRNVKYIALCGVIGEED